MKVKSSIKPKKLLPLLNCIRVLIKKQNHFETTEWNNNNNNNVIKTFANSELKNNKKSPSLLEKSFFYEFYSKGMFEYTHLPSTHSTVVYLGDLVQDIILEESQ